jgi:hypothetical protein
MRIIASIFYLAFIYCKESANETLAILPTLSFEKFLPNDETNYETHHWIGLYEYKEDNTTLLQIARFDTIYQRNRPEIAEYEMTPNKISLTALEFRKLFTFLARSKQENMEILNAGYVIQVYRSFNPYYVSILKKIGRLGNENWRGVVLDYSEIKEILRSGSHLLEILGL